ncbi:hypothetical protein CPB83DRAFT_855423, partial [Crepidotus variabilis]
MNVINSLKAQIFLPQSSEVYPKYQASMLCKKKLAIVFAQIALVVGLVLDTASTSSTTDAGTTTCWSWGVGTEVSTSSSGTLTSTPYQEPTVSPTTTSSSTTY